MLTGTANLARNRAVRKQAQRARTFSVVYSLSWSITVCSAPDAVSMAVTKEKGSVVRAKSVRASTSRALRCCSNDSRSRFVVAFIALGF